jgi:hypothetical protein
MTTRIVSVLLFEDVEVLDFAGPFEVFNVAGLLSGIPVIMRAAASSCPCARAR